MKIQCDENDKLPAITSVPNTPEPAENRLRQGKVAPKWLVDGSEIAGTTALKYPSATLCQTIWQYFRPSGQEISMGILAVRPQSAQTAAAPNHADSRLTLQGTGQLAGRLNS